MQLKVKGVTFPDPGSSAPVFTPPPAAPSPSTAAAAVSSSPSPSNSGGASTHAAETDDFGKLKSDLVVVEEKIKLCREMLPHSPGVEHDPAFADEIGFLVRVCARLCIVALPHSLLREVF